MENYKIISRLERHRKTAGIITPLLLIGILGAFVGSPIVLGVLAPILETASAGLGDTVTGIWCGLFALFLIVICIVTPINNKALERLNKEYKELVLSKIMPILPEGITYDPKGGFTLEEFQKTHMVELPMHEGYTYTCESEDSLVGSYNGKKFKQSDIKIVRTIRRPGEKTETTTIIDGVLTCFEYKAQIKHNVMIMPHMRLNAIAPELRHTSRVQMENVEFNEKFDVFSSDAHYVYYLLTPHFMEHLTELYRVTKGRLFLRFDDDNLYMLRDISGGIFSPPLNEQITMQEVIRRSKEDVNYIFKTIDILQMGDGESGIQSNDEKKD